VNRALVLGSLLASGVSGCAPAIWGARQVRCDAETREIRLRQEVLPLWLYNTDDVDEDCEVKAYGIQYASFDIDDGRIGIEGADEVDFEIDSAVFDEDAGSYPRLDVHWEEPVVAYDDDIGLFNRIDLSYGPALPLFVMEAASGGWLGYGQDPGGVDPSFEPLDDELRMICTDCYVNARVASTTRLRMDEQPEDRTCQQTELSGDVGLCTSIQFAEIEAPASVICVEPDIGLDDQIVVEAPDSNVKIVVMPGANPERIRVAGADVVALYGPPDLGFWVSDQNRPDTFRGDLPIADTFLAGGPELDFGTLDSVIVVGLSGEQALQTQCQISRREVTTDGDDDDDDE
jgi:hypothetical protein